MIWKHTYRQCSKDHGTLGFFRSLLNRITVKDDPKKAVDATLEFVRTVVVGHLLSCACEILGITKLDSEIQLPPGVKKGSPEQQRQHITTIATQVVENCTLIEQAYTGDDIEDLGDHMYNYARVLCHFGALVLEFTDAWAEGDGERIYRCWRLFLPHFKTTNHTKYSLEALRLQYQGKCTLSPQLAHQILWDRFVNPKAGLGHNIPCDLYNEHVNKLLKHVILSMGSNLTETSLQRAARSVSTLQTICRQFDKESEVPVGTHAHSTRSDAQDVAKVTMIVMKEKLLHITPGRAHSTYRNMKLNPLWSWDKNKTKDWIEKKKKDFMKNTGTMRGEGDESQSDATD